MLRLTALSVFCFLTLGGMMAVMRGQEAPQNRNPLPSAYWRGEPLHIGDQVQLLASDDGINWRSSRRPTSRQRKPCGRPPSPALHLRIATASLRIIPRIMSPGTANRTSAR
jgi:hypothetical protein